MPGFSVVANPLFALTKKEVEFKWSSSCAEAFQALKSLLINAPILAFLVFDRGFVLDTDASGVGLGAVLAQKQDDGAVRPIAYASRTLQKHAQNYGVTELEALGVVWAVRHFRHYLYGYHCDVYTDHEALKSLLNTPHPSGKLARWGLALQEVDLSIFYRPGKKNVLADELSQSPIQGVLVPEENLVAAVASPQVSAKSGEGSLCERQHLDPGIRQIMLYLQSRTLPTDEKEARELALTAQQYVLLDGVLHFIGKDQALKVILPEQERKKLFDEVHGGAFGGHLGDTCGMQRSMVSCQRNIGGLG